MKLKEVCEILSPKYELTPDELHEWILETYGKDFESLDYTIGSAENLLDVISFQGYLLNKRCNEFIITLGKELKMDKLFNWINTKIN